MAEQINNIFKKYDKLFLNRKEEMKYFTLKYFEDFFKEHSLENLERIDATERIKTAGFHPELSAWRNSYENIIISSCEVIRGKKKRFDYKFVFIKEKLYPSITEKVEVETSKIEKDFREFTEEEKEEYRRQKEKEKEEVKEDFQSFLKEQTIKDVVEVIEKSKEIPSFQKIKSTEEIELPEGVESFEAQQIHGYSIRNYLMVLSQVRKRQDDKFIGVINSFWNWKKQGAQVLKNPDKSKPYSYKIIVPISEGDILKGFKLGSVFDISQTNKYKEYLKQHEIKEKEIEWKEEIEYDSAIKFVKDKLPVIIIEEEIKDSEKRGSYDTQTKTITIHQNSSHTVFHEFGKHIAFSELKIAEDVEEGSMKEEILAEITCYVLMKKFEKAEEYKINYDFGYSNCWALNILDEFKFREFENIYATISDYVKNL